MIEISKSAAGLLVAARENVTTATARRQRIENSTGAEHQQAVAANEQATAQLLAAFRTADLLVLCRDGRPAAQQTMSEHSTLVTFTDDEAAAAYAQVRGESTPTFTLRSVADLSDAPVDGSAWTRLLDETGVHDVVFNPAGPLGFAFETELVRSFTTRSRTGVWSFRRRSTAADRAPWPDIAGRREMRERIAQDYEQLTNLIRGGALDDAERFAAALDYLDAFGSDYDVYTAQRLTGLWRIRKRDYRRGAKQMHVAAVKLASIGFPETATDTELDLVDELERLISAVPEQSDWATEQLRLSAFAIHHLAAGWRPDEVSEVFEHYQPLQPQPSK